MSATPKVTVSITAYNHAPFLRQALDGALAQRTDFPVGILVGEDDSTDGTREIVREYAARHPDCITAYFHDSASKLRIKGRLTGRNNLAHNLRAARGEYIALLDGDDFWTDDTKLARQVAQLDADPTLSTSFHHALVVDEAGAPVETAPTIRTVKERYTLEEMIAGDFEAQTCTVLFRRSAIDPLPAWFFETPVGDFPLHVLNGHRGDFGFIDRTMGCYRVHAGGIWSGGRGTQGWAERSAEQARRTLGRYEMMVDLLSAVARHSAPRYRRAAHRRLTLYAFEAARIGAGQRDKATVRRNLGVLLRAHPWSPTVRWKALPRLLRRAL